MNHKHLLSALTVTATWDPVAMNAYGAAMGREQYIKGTNIMANELILIVEDQFPLALDMQKHLRDAGYRIVGPDEIDPARGYISIDSPLAKALLKRGEGEVVKVMLPGGEAELELTAVRYSPA